MFEVNLPFSGTYCSILTTQPFQSLVLMARWPWQPSEAAETATKAGRPTGFRQLHAVGVLTVICAAAKWQPLNTLATFFGTAIARASRATDIGIRSRQPPPLTPGQVSVMKSANALLVLGLGLTAAAMTAAAAEQCSNPCYIVSSYWPFKECKAACEVEVCSRGKKTPATSQLMQTYRPFKCATWRVRMRHALMLRRMGRVGVAGSVLHPGCGVPR